MRKKILAAAAIILIVGACIGGTIANFVKDFRVHNVVTTKRSRSN